MNAMAIETILMDASAASLAGLLLSVLLEQMMRPRPCLRRPASAWSLHSGLCLGVQALLTLLLGRPWFALTITMALLLLLVFVNNAKLRALHEPFVFQDHEYFLDALRYPRLYLPFLGWAKVAGATAAAAIAIALGLFGEIPSPGQWDGSGLAGIQSAILLTATLLIALGTVRLPTIHLQPEQDVKALGLLACLWSYGRHSRQPWHAASPFAQLKAPAATGPLPHLVAIQSESFFDPRPYFPGIRPEILSQFDLLRQEGLASGKLQVPAWGANTVRSECAFLTGIPNAALGIHRFNPYAALAAHSQQLGLASYLKQLGYRTILLHPYHRQFYRRDRVHTILGFDEFHDITAFSDADRSGPYIGDLALADKVAAWLKEAHTPLFIHVITMENHGPLHLEQCDASDVQALYDSAPEPGCTDLTVYLRHLRHADQMIGRLRQSLEQTPRGASLCWYGDHVPIMPEVYRHHGRPPGEVDYVYWSKDRRNRQAPGMMQIENLALTWLRELGLIVL
ncbi:LTA synthase family protein [Herbaspirillum rubrisubalbicans]|uniref:LTA synthase family protein n=1 Tax=Herbaspirillum rubrisubalbicans TaxID=80842 RepID=UPI001E4248EE|nr:LTA synthase family protein [Herbaspirillum rubrisubalbicans]